MTTRIWYLDLTRSVLLKLPYPQRSKYPTFEVPGSKNFQGTVFWNQKPQLLGTWTLWLPSGSLLHVSSSGGGGALLDSSACRGPAGKQQKHGGLLDSFLDPKSTQTIKPRKNSRPKKNAHKKEKTSRKSPPGKGPKDLNTTRVGASIRGTGNRSCDCCGPVLGTWAL